MASDIMQQVQEDSRKKKQQGVLLRMNDQPDQQGMGTGTRETPEPTVVEKAKEVQEEEVVAKPEYKQSARRLAADLREDGTTTESWEAARQEVADRGARYRAALQSPKGDQTPTEMAASYDKEKEFQTQDYGDAGILRSEKISQYDLIEDDETGLPSKTYREALARNAKQMDIPNLDKFLSIMDAYEKSAGLQKAAKTKTELTIARDTAEDATKQLRQLFPNIGNLEDAAIKDSIIKSNIVDRDAAETFFPETRGTGFSMDGSDVEDAVSRIKKQREDAQKRLDAQNQKVVKGAVEKAKETGPGGAGTRRQPTDAELAAQKALEPMDMDEVMGETVITAEAPEEPGTAAPPTEDLGYRDQWVGGDYYDEDGTLLVKGTPRGTLAMLDEDEQVQLSKAPGGKFLKPALDSLLEGDLGGFNEAFGQTSRADRTGLLGGIVGKDDRIGLSTAMGKTPQFRIQVASDLTKAIDKDNSKIYQQVSSELENVLLKKLYSEYEQLGRDKPEITQAEAQKAREDAQRAAKIIMGLQFPHPETVGMSYRNAHFDVAKDNPQYEILQGLIGDEIDSPWLGQNLSEDARKNMRENYFATETLGQLLGTDVRRGRFSVLKDAKSDRHKIIPRTESDRMLREIGFDPDNPEPHSAQQPAMDMDEVMGETVITASPMEDLIASVAGE